LVPLMQDTLPAAVRRLPMLKESDNLPAAPIKLSTTAPSRSNSSLQALSGSVAPFDSASDPFDEDGTASETADRPGDPLASQGDARNARYAVFNPSADHRIGRDGRRFLPAVLKMNGASTATGALANRIQPASAYVPPPPDVSVGPFTL